MFSRKDDAALVMTGLKKGFFLEDELRECRQIQKKSPEASVVTILAAEGYLSDENYHSLLESHADMELKRLLEENLRLSPKAFLIRAASYLAEASDATTELPASVRARRSGVLTATHTLPICPKCGTLLEKAARFSGVGQECRNCGHVFEVQDPKKDIEIDSDMDIEKQITSEDLVGQVIGHYKLDSWIGEGGMGVVYRGKHLTLDRDVAVKILPQKLATGFYRSRFLAESRAAAKLTHPNVVQIYDAGEEAGRPYIIMEFIEGTSVKQLISSRERLNLAFAVRIVSEAAEGLSAVHRLNFVHRDVKPGNIMISFSGVAKIMDFGLVKDLEVGGDVTRAGMILGTPYFMAPEQFKSNMEIDHRVDIYALGVTFYCMLTGKHPFQGKTPYQIMNAHLNEKYRPIGELNPDVPEELTAIIDRMLEKDRDRRYQSLQEFMGDLSRVRLPKTADSES